VIKEATLVSGFLAPNFSCQACGHRGADIRPLTCAGGFNAAYTFVAQPGDTINFGTLSLNSFIFGDGTAKSTQDDCDRS
jgi:hypothetical protein